METNNKEKEKKGLGGKIGRSITIVLLVFFGFWIGWDLGAYSYIKYLTYLREKQGEPWMNEYIKILKERGEANKNDFVGGNTPEETIDLFVAALKKGDYELASRYFTIEQQEVWRKKFQELSKEQVDVWVGKIEENKKNWRKEQEGENQFVIKYNTGTGDDEITHFIVLEKNVNNKWKIGSF